MIARRSSQLEPTQPEYVKAFRLRQPGASSGKYTFPCIRRSLQNRSGLVPPKFGMALLPISAAESKNDKHELLESHPLAAFFWFSRSAQPSTGVPSPWRPMLGKSRLRRARANGCPSWCSPTRVVRLGMLALFPTKFWLSAQPKPSPKHVHAYRFLGVGLPTSPASRRPSALVLGNVRWKGRGRPDERHGRRP